MTDGRPPRPSALPFDPEPVPGVLRDSEQWVVWRYKFDTDRDEWTKPPIDATTGRFASSTDPDTWTSFDRALECHRRDDTDTDGLGFVVSDDDQLVGFDLDDCRDPDTGVCEPWADELLEDVPTYAEVSPSGTGIRGIGLGFVPDGGNRADIDGTDGHLEMYETGRYLTVTGHHIEGTQADVRVVKNEIVDVHAEYIADDRDSKDERPPRDVPAEPFDLEDAELLERARSAKNGAEFDALWRGDTSGYPSQSEADLALCSHLAFWTAGDRGRIDRLFRQSDLYREKWDRDDYRERTIDKTLEGRTDFYSGERTPAEADGGTAVVSSGGQSSAEEIRTSWLDVREYYAQEGVFQGRYKAAEALENRTSWMYVREEDRLWVYDSETGRYNPWGEQQVAAMLEHGLGDLYSRAEKGEVIDRLMARNQLHRDELNGGTQPGYHFCVGNGVIDLETGELHPHSPDYKFTRGVSHDYDTGDADREPVLEFLDDITQREADRDTLLDHLAHGLMPGHPYRAFVMMYGEGANGKTQIGRLFRGFVGSENAASVELQDLTGSDDFATGALPGKMINIGDDVEVTEIRNASALKRATGGGIMRANEKNEKQFDFENEAAMFFSANEPPRITEEKDAIADRLYPIELPYQFRGEGEYDPDNPLHKRKVPQYSQKLLANDAAMRGLLELCVEHAKRLIETEGAYSMPEGPSKRRLRYEAASDPIARFALRCFKSGDFEDAILKDDAYAVYKALCEADDERTTDGDTFKKMLTQQAGVDVEPCRVRWLTPGDKREPAWRYVKFSEDAEQYLSDRLRERYFPDGDRVDGKEKTSDEENQREQVGFGAIPISEAARSLTGYISVTVEVATTDAIGKEQNGIKAIVTDTSGAIDVVAWDEPFISALEDVEGECVVIKNIEVIEYDGKRQLSPVDGLTKIERIQAGVGHTGGEERANGQAAITTAPEHEIEGTQGRIAEFLRARDAPKDIVSVGEIAGALSESPSDVEDALDILAENGRVIRRENGVSLE